MALTDLIDIELAVPNPGELQEFWNRRGLATTGDGQLGTPERSSQLRLKESHYRHVSHVRLATESQDDLVATAASLDAMGAQVTLGDGWLESVDPVLGHVVRIEVTATESLKVAPTRELNGPGRLARANRRSEAAMREWTPNPRRVGHVVFGSPDTKASVDYYVNGLGFRVSDTMPDLEATFLRCSSDHHNVFILPSPVACMNHYALELDDFDAIGLRGVEVVQERPDASVYGMGRHIVGSNIFWYLLDPAGGMFEFFTDMDQITDDELWDREQRRDDWDPFTVATYESGTSKMDFFLPSDIDAIAAGRERDGL